MSVFTCAGFTLPGFDSILAVVFYMCSERLGYSFLCLHGKQQYCGFLSSLCMKLMAIMWNNAANTLPFKPMEHSVTVSAISLKTRHDTRFNATITWLWCDCGVKGLISQSITHCLFIQPFTRPKRATVLHNKIKPVQKNKR